RDQVLLTHGAMDHSSQANLGRSVLPSFVFLACTYIVAWMHRICQALFAIFSRRVLGAWCHAVAWEIVRIVSFGRGSMVKSPARAGGKLCSQFWTYFKF